MSGQCVCCGGQLDVFAQALVRQRYPADYRRCRVCGAVQIVETPWLAEAYSEAITTADLGLVQRNLALADISAGLLTLLRRADGPLLDDGGGYGLFVRLMRDRGFDFYRRDPFCANLFARGCDEADLRGRTVNAVTAFEVLEHLPDPLVDLQRMRAHSDTLLFSTEILPPAAPLPGAWWYYGLEHGQHVTIYTVPALQALARRLGLQLSTDGRFLHLFSPHRIPTPLFRLITRRPVARLVSALRRRPSLLAHDRQQAVSDPPCN
jgi:hypothetical protein